MVRLNSLLIIIILLSATSCGIMREKTRKERFEDCVERMIKNDAPALKALEICKTIHNVEEDKNVK